MSSTLVPTGNEYSGPVYRDGLRVIQTGGTNTTAYAMGAEPLTVAQYKAIIAAFDQGATGANGYLPLGAGDAGMFMVLGDDNDETVLLAVSAYDPLVQYNSTTKNLEVVGYEERFVGIFTFTLGTLAATAGTHPLTGVASTDLWADTVTLTKPDPAAAVPANQAPPGYYMHSPANDLKAFIIVPSDGAALLRVQTDIGTADRALVLGRRMKGDATRSN